MPLHLRCFECRITDACSVSIGITRRFASLRPPPFACGPSVRSIRNLQRRCLPEISPIEGEKEVQQYGNTAIYVRDLHVTFGEKQVLAGADLSVERGTFHILLGPNGCGKSTLLRVLGGLLRPDSGEVSVAQPVGFVFQNPDHQIVMPSVGADACFGLGRFRLPHTAVRAQTLDSLDLVGMAGFLESATHTLSGGQRQRVAIAGALAEDPLVLLLDELTTFLDVGDQKGVLEAVRAAVGGPRQVAALWVTHRTEELRYADSASFMDEGRILISGSPQQVADYMRSLGARVDHW